jgi:hypothetical protein
MPGKVISGKRKVVITRAELCRPVNSEEVKSYEAIH